MSPSRLFGGMRSCVIDHRSASIAFLVFFHFRDTTFGCLHQTLLFPSIWGELISVLGQSVKMGSSRKWKKRDRNRGREAPPFWGGWPKGCAAWRKRSMRERGRSLASPWAFRGSSIAKRGSSTSPHIFPTEGSGYSFL